MQNAASENDVSENEQEESAMAHLLSEKYFTHLKAVVKKA